MGSGSGVGEKSASADFRNKERKRLQALQIKVSLLQGDDFFFSFSGRMFKGLGVRHSFGVDQKEVSKHTPAI